MNVTRLIIECSIADGPRRSRSSPRQPEPGQALGRVPRVSRLMALALRFDALVDQGHVADYAALARLGRVSRTRITQIMSLLLLAPDIQEALLFLPRVARGRDPFHLRALQNIATQPNWRRQRVLWQALVGALEPPVARPS